MKKILLTFLAVALVVFISFRISATDATVATTAPQIEDGGYELALRQAYTLHQIKQKMVDLQSMAATQPLSLKTNTGSATWYVSSNIYHTIHIVCTNTTTNLTVTLSRSIDTVNFYPFSTNNFTNDIMGEVTATGAWNQFKAVVTFEGATNGAVALNYIGNK